MLGACTHNTCKQKLTFHSFGEVCEFLPGNERWKGHSPELARQTEFLETAGGFLASLGIAQDTEPAKPQQ